MVIEWETELADGWIMHAVRFDEYGDIHMVNIWESIEKMEETFVNRLMPVMKKIGIPEPRSACIIQPSANSVSHPTSCRSLSYMSFVNPFPVIMDIIAISLHLPSSW